MGGCHIFSCGVNVLELVGVVFSPSVHLLGALFLRFLTLPLTLIHLFSEEKNKESKKERKEQRKKEKRRKEEEERKESGVKRRSF